MKNQDFQYRLGQTTQLKNHQEIQAADDLSGNSPNQLSEVNHCPHCVSSLFCYWGQSNDLPRYRCKHLSPFTLIASILISIMFK